MKYELAEATALLVKHKAWDIAKQVVSYVQITMKKKEAEELQGGE